MSRLLGPARRRLLQRPAHALVGAGHRQRNLEEHPSSNRHQALHNDVEAAWRTGGGFRLVRESRHLDTPSYGVRKNLHDVLKQETGEDYDQNTRTLPTRSR